MKRFRFAMILMMVGAGLFAAMNVPAQGGGKGVTIGFIYVGPKDDYGYNQAHSAGAAAVKKMPGVTIKEEERVPETVDVQKTMESMIQLDGAKIVFPTSFGYFDPHILKLAKKYPQVMFLHCGGMWDAKKHPKNVGSYFGYIDECEYLSGIVAASSTKSEKLGFVAAKPIPQVLRNINAFTLGGSQRQSEDYLFGHFHRRMVAPRERSGSHHHADRQGRRCHDVPRR